MVGKFLISLIFYCVFNFSGFKGCSKSGMPSNLEVNKIKLEAFVGLKDSFDFSNSVWNGFSIIEDSTYSIGIDKNGSFLYKCNLSQTNPIFRSNLLPKKLIDVMKYGEISSFHLSSDSVLSIFQNNRLLIINLYSNQIIFERDISVSDSSALVFQDYSIPIYFNETLGSLFVQLSHTNGMTKRKYGFDTEFHGEIDIKNNSLTIIPIKYPSSYGNGEKGANSFMKVAINNSKIAYSSTSEKWVELYSISKQYSKKVKAQSLFHVDNGLMDENEYLDKDISLRNFKLNFIYENIFYDKYRELYYRVYARQMKERKKDDLYNTLADKKKGVVLFNKTQILADIQIDESGVFEFGAGKEGFFYRSKIEIRNDSIYQRYNILVPQY